MEIIEDVCMLFFNLKIFEIGYGRKLGYLGYIIERLVKFFKGIVRKVFLVEIVIDDKKWESYFGFFGIIIVFFSWSSCVFVDLFGYLSEMILKVNVFDYFLS